jgi:hypothetical protein
MKSSQTYKQIHNAHFGLQVGYSCSTHHGKEEGTEANLYVLKIPEIFGGK